MRTLQSERKTHVRLLRSLPLLLWALTSAHALDSQHNIRQFGHVKWTIDDGSFGSTTSSIAQTSDGFVWFGTDIGMLRYDGIHYIRDPEINDSLPSSLIVSLAAARDGSLWIGTSNGLSHWANNRLVNYPNLRGFINSILEDREGKVWFSLGQNESFATDKLCFVVEQGTTCYGEAQGVSMWAGTSLTQASNGTLWLTTYDGVARWESGSFTTHKLEGERSKLGLTGVRAITTTAAGPLWVGAGTPGPGLGLQQLDGDRWKAFVTSGFDSSTLRVDCLLLDHERTLWIGTEDEGLYRIRGSHVDRFRKADGLSSDEVTNILEDHEGNIWVSTVAGIDCFHQLVVTTAPISPNGASSVEVDGVLASRDGTIWVARPGSLDALRGDKISSIHTGKGLPGSQVTSLLEDRAGRLWVGVDEGLWVYRKGTFQSIQRADRRALGIVTGLAEDVDGSIWAEVKRAPRALIRIRHLSVVEEFAAPKMPVSRQVMADPEGGIWLGLISGDLARYRQGRLEVFSYPHPRGPHEVRQLTITSEGMVLGATQTGLVAWKKGTQRILTMRNGLPCENIFAQALDNRGSLWLSTECGLIQLGDTEVQRWWQDPEAHLRTRVLTILDGVRPGYALFNGSARTPDGRLWFVQYTALQTFDPSAITTNRVAPPVYIEKLLADQKSYPTHQPIRLPPLIRNLEIDYTGLSFVVPQKVQFRYKLENHDVDWQTPGTRREAFYSDLAPGNYTFRVIACNNDGLWNEKGATLDFNIAPTWYQTTLFRLTCVSGLLLFLWALYQLRMRQLALEFNASIETRVAERTRIARELHDTLLQSLHGLMFRFQAARNMLPRRTDEAMAALDGAIERTEQAITESREAIQDLRSASADQDDIAKSIAATAQQLAKSFQNVEGLPLFSVVVEGEPRPLAPLIQDEVWRVAHEALMNAYRHAKARRIESEIRYDHHAFRLRVRDDGRGIDQTISKDGGRPGHWGLPGMRERAKRIGATLEIWSEAGAGTEVQLSVSAAIAYKKDRNNSPIGLFRKRKDRGQQH